MGVFQESLTQKTNNATLCTAAVSSDMIRWRDVEVDDISTSGLKFYSDKSYKVGQVLKFDLKVYSMITEFSIPLEGRIIEEKKSVDGFSYAIKYDKIEKHAQIQLDEIFKANIAAKTTSEVATGDGIYSFILNPGFRPAKA
ncbi:PilZ domain-containing protein [Acetivibrio cellulolyticus]|uniref:PilZ domain-containing protein n=1 Tax=Acetivibrio cellulolyticus TaxID=35830 RepID=UPI0001E2D18B|nr:PilZ domain-containing protein [Acetivibrio cellulolyticus]